MYILTIKWPCHKGKTWPIRKQLLWRLWSRQWSLCFRQVSYLTSQKFCLCSVSACLQCIVDSVPGFHFIASVSVSLQPFAHDISAGSHAVTRVVRSHNIYAWRLHSKVKGHSIPIASNFIHYKCIQLLECGCRVKTNGGMGFWIEAWRISHT